MVDDVLEDQDPARPGDEPSDVGQFRPLHRRQRPTVQVEAGEPLDDVMLPHEDRNPLRLRVSHDVGQVREPALRHEEGTRPVTRREGPPDHLLALGDVEAALRLRPSPQGDIGERDVVLEPRIRVVGDDDRHEPRVDTG